MGAASSSINRPESADHNNSSSSSNSAIPADSPKPDSPPDSATPSMSDSASKTQSDTKPLEEEEAAKPKEDESEIGEEEEEEEVGECGFCLFMKGGGCKESFTAWEKCIEEAEKTNEDIAQKCFDATSALKTCMLAHPDYYEPILRAEKAAEEEVVKELEKEKAAEKEEQDNKEKEKEVVIELENEKAPESSKTAPASSEEVGGNDSGGKQ